VSATLSSSLLSSARGLTDVAWGRRDASEQVRRCADQVHREGIRHGLRRHVRATPLHSVVKIQSARRLFRLGSDAAAATSWHDDYAEFGGKGGYTFSEADGKTAFLYSNMSIQREAGSLALLVRFWTEILDDFRRFVDEIWRFQTEFWADPAARDEAQGHRRGTCVTRFVAAILLLVRPVRARCSTERERLPCGQGAVL